MLPVVGTADCGAKFGPMHGHLKVACTSLPSWTQGTASAIMSYLVYNYNELE